MTGLEKKEHLTEIERDELADKVLIGLDEWMQDGLKLLNRIATALEKKGDKVLP